MTATYRRETIGYAAKIASQLLRNKISDRDLEMFQVLSVLLYVACGIGGVSATFGSIAVHPILFVPTGITFFGFFRFSERLIECIDGEISIRYESAQRVAQYVAKLEAELGG